MLLQAAVAAAAAGDDARLWLDRMAEALRRLDYEGVFVYRHGGGMTTMALVHGRVGGVERERLYALDGAPREIVRDGDGLTYVLPDGGAVRIPEGVPPATLGWRLAGGLDAVEAGYRLHTAGEGRVAGRRAVVVAIEPRDRYRYGYRLWLDREHALPLRVELREGGRVLETVLFTSLRVGGAIPRERFEAAPGGTRLRMHEVPAAGPQADPGRWRLGRLPPGFRLVGRGMTRLPGAGDEAVHLLISDGLAAVSVYVEEAGAAGGLEGLVRMGAVSAYGRILDGHRVTAVGEVPPPTVRMVAEGIEEGG
ncbi:MucB/RseB-like sigma(E) regulatory protein [Inmirania thermothiophila]|uniref:MucB/RseB-like sigma(E) regulatory protein n=1 Tax=Inmirania thermothiophila TaxID=1750597 RepID=A0A3N1XZU1_9GAMM|nr:MucB/RseB-like sigma(E) regulatory protein [Inmirania thermothiophila]